ncbi:MAG TPA: hypothetical protein PL148_07215, partial [Candidatus Aminicenantes bacterium]|nr:hypothetical protein [Candidatus Aminicenantes bacterium]
PNASDLIFSADPAAGAPLGPAVRENDPHHDRSRFGRNRPSNLVVQRRQEAGRHEDGRNGRAFEESGDQDVRRSGIRARGAFQVFIPVESPIYFPARISG